MKGWSLSLTGWDLSGIIGIIIDLLMLAFVIHLAIENKRLKEKLEEVGI